MNARVARWALAAACALGACSKDELTQIVIVVDSDWNGFARVEIDVDGFTKDVNASAKTADAALPRRLTLVHDGGKLGPLAVEVRAYEPGEPEPVLVEHRKGIFFEKDESLLLKIDLLFECIGSKCDEACIEGPKCVTAEEATELVPWDADYERLPPRFDVDAGAHVIHTDDGGLIPVGPDSGPLEDAGPDTGSGHAGEGGGPGGGSGGESGKGGTDGGESGTGGESGSGGTDAGPTALFAFTPSNFDPSILEGVDPMPMVIDCSTATFDSTALTFTDWCGVEPIAIVVEQSDLTELVLLVATDIDVKTTGTLRLIGNRPVALVALGDASMAGTLDAAAHGAVSGAGGGASCASGASTGTNGGGGDSLAAGGGSGGGFGTPGGAGGSGFGGSVHVSGGAAGGNTALTPLRGGCAGGAGGAGQGNGGAGGGGGGAIQLTVAGELAVTGDILAGGGGGGVGDGAQDGGGGGGSGGAILLEAGSVAIDANAVLAANGGGGGAGQPSTLGVGSSDPGEDGRPGSAAATGGAPVGSGGDGGDGASMLPEARDGTNGQMVITSGGGGGGGGGGVGRIRINGASSCGPGGAFSPQPSVECASCAVSECPRVPEHGCVGDSNGGSFYYLCTPSAPFAEARLNCSDVGMMLVRVDSQAENDWLVSKGQDVWIGASDAAAEGDWRWVEDNVPFWSGDYSGSAVGGLYVNWETTQPNGSGDAALLNVSSQQWSDEPIGDSFPYVCELPP